MTDSESAFEEPAHRGMGFQPMSHRQDADATKPHGQDARATFRTPAETNPSAKMRNPKKILNGARAAGWVYVVLVGVVAATAGRLFLDPAVSTWLLHHPNHWHTNFWVDAFRQLGKAEVPIWLLLSFSCLTNRWRPTVITLAALVLVCLCVCPLKAMVRRSRPDARAAAAQQYHDPQLSSGTSSQPLEVPWQKKVSFPSGDTAVVFAAATTLSWSLGRLWAPVLFTAAGVIGLLRVTAYVHYPSDVIAGATIGILCGLYAVRRLTDLPRWSQFRLEGRRRMVAALILLVVVPLGGWMIGMRSLPVFLTAYGLPVAAFAVIWLAVARSRGWKSVFL